MSLELSSFQLEEGEEVGRVKVAVEFQEVVSVPKVFDHRDHKFVDPVFHRVSQACLLSDFQMLLPTAENQ